MSVQILQSQNTKPTGHTLDGKPIYTASPSQYEERYTNCTPTVLSLNAGSSSSVVLTWASDDLHQIEEIELMWTATNTDATNAPTFRNVFMTLREFKVLVNGTQLVYLDDQQKIQATIQKFLEKECNQSVYNALAKCREETTATLTGESVPVSSTHRFKIPLFWLVDALKDITPNSSGVYKVQLDFSFAVNQGSAPLNGYFVLSNTANNAYGTNLTYSDIRVKQLIKRHSDARMYKNPSQLAMVLTKYDTLKKSGISWTTANTDKQTFSLSNDWTKRKYISGVYAWLFDITGASAYNAGNCCEMRSGPDVIGFDIKSRSNKIVDLAHSTNDLAGRKVYQSNVWKKKNGTYPPLEVVNNSDDLGKTYLCAGTYLDLTCISNDEDGELVSGINNFQNNIEFTLYCASSVSASVDLYVMLEYKEIAYIDKNKNLKVLNE